MMDKIKEELEALAPENIKSAETAVLEYLSRIENSIPRASFDQDVQAANSALERIKTWIEAQAGLYPADCV